MDDILQRWLTYTERKSMRHALQDIIYLLELIEMMRDELEERR